MNELSLLHIILFYLVIINVATFFVYGIDKAASKRVPSHTQLNYAERELVREKSKRKAKKPKRRIREVTLLGLAALGGSIGAWIGMKVWHHKTLHKKFRFGVPAIIIVQLLIIYYLSLYQK